MNDLFASNSEHLAPLAEQLRPRQLSEVVGQKHLLGPNGSLRQMLQRKALPSLIFWGPPGTGKTTLARLMAQEVGAHYLNLNAVDSGVKSLRESGEEGRRRRIEFSERTVLFVDEIHRFNKSQQDVLLPYLEAGDLILIGATTENPSYELNRALLSRARVLVLHRLERDELALILKKAFAHEHIPVRNVIDEDSEELIYQLADGDGRRLLNSLEILLQHFKTSDPDKTETAPKALLKEEIFDLLSSQRVSYDKNSEYHYDIISAFIKSVRGSDTDAAIYYLARMLLGGEDPTFISRRLIILASEDIGNADPRALPLAVAAHQACEILGMPECRIPLAQLTVFLSQTFKSNASYMAINKAMEVAQKEGDLPVPLHLRSSKTAMSKSLGYGVGYKYPHDSPKHWTPQRYLPEALKETSFYETSSMGAEKKLDEYMQWIKGRPSKPEGEANI
ncbi:MAG: replication-associated recombination protein A [Bdellovibrionota bacterium]